MKHILLLAVLVALALVAVAVVALAQQGPPDMPMMSDDDMGPMMGRGMGGMMGGPAIAISEDNMVYVVAGGQLLKYDASLQLVAQAELPMSEMGGGRMGGHSVGRSGGGGGGGLGTGRGGMMQ